MKSRLAVISTIAGLLVAWGLLAASPGLCGDPAIPNYHSQTDYALTSEGAFWWETYGFGNPAFLTYVPSPDMTFAWKATESAHFASDIDEWACLLGLPGLGFGARHEETPLGSVTDYRLALALGNKATSLGLSYQWSTGNTCAFRRGKVFGLGALVRPMPQASIGLSGYTATEGSAREAVADIAVRPLGDDVLTLFGDYAIQKEQVFRDGLWSAGAAIRILPGIHITSRYFNTHFLTAGLSVDLGRLGLASQAHYDRNQHRSYNTYRVRAGAYSSNLIATYMGPRQKYLGLDLHGQLKYQRYRWFDSGHSLTSVLAAIEAAKNDPRVGGIALNASGMVANREVAWEVREKLRDFKTSGKSLIVFLDLGGIDQYHFASVADKIAIDPTGIITLEGYLMGRTFLKGTLAKMGLAFNEWRFFTYKSADEALSRDSMSEPDREQRQQAIDEYYRVAKADICEARHIDPAEFDRMVNEQPIFMPKDALEKGLVDTLARWDAADEVVKALEGKSKRLVGAAGLATGSVLDSYGAREGFAPQDRWGTRPQIAVIYAIGECAMDTGIKARSLVKVVEAAGKNRDFKAIVFRVDSPGGDAMASDIVAEAIKKCAEKKPVIVSQGLVAASGGYWLSMYGTEIVSAPQTITGSIGVIGGWLYNAGLKEKIGMSTDHVQVGEHADLGFGMTVPFLGATVPDRDLTPNEFAMMERIIKEFYKDFVTKVASSRKMDYAAVDKVAQGRIWPGVDAKANGLIDTLGGLETAIMLAKDKAGIPREEAVTIVELPKPELFNTELFSPKLTLRQMLLAWAGRDHTSWSGSPGGSGGADATGESLEAGALGALMGIDAGALRYLRLRLEHNGEPMPLLPLDDMDIILDADMQ